MKKGERQMTQLLILDKSSSFEGMKDFISLDKNIDIEKFDEVSFKKFAELYKELTESEVTLYFDPDLRRIIRFALNIKLYIRTPDACFCETKRVYHENDPDKRRESVKLRPYANRETRFRNKTAGATLVRCIAEEYEDLDTTLEIDLVSPFEQISTYESHAYLNFLTREASVKYKADLVKRIYPEGRSYLDNDVRIYQDWIPKSHPELREIAYS